MLPIGPLMIEHRLIERAVPLMRAEMKRLEKGGAVDCQFIAAIVDFFRTYADRCHHGKEEDILFAALKKKKISPEHKRVLNELLAEHVYGRETVGKLLKAVTAEEVTVQLSRLIDLYPKHIEKEDKHFFVPVMDYFAKREREEMLVRMREFDQRLIHEKYQGVIGNMEKAGK